MKELFALALLFALLTAIGCVSQNGGGNIPPVINNTTQPPVIVGNDRDIHGCYASAGYSWCDVKQKCLRPWEDNCTAAIPPRACTEEAKLCPDGSAVGRSGPNCEFAACPTVKPPTNYTLYGKITIGPLCPVEPCNRTYDYSTVNVNVYDSVSKNRVVAVNADANGYYGIRLAPGDYLVNVTDATGSSFGMNRLDYTQLVSLREGHRIGLDFEIDTGIR